MANSSCSGGRRRKTGRRKTSKKPKKGGYYGFSGGIAPGAALWTPKSEMGGYAISDRGGNTQYGMGRRRRKGKKKTMRGGSKYGAVSASFTGNGQRGMGDYVGTSINKPGFATMGEFNDNGPKSLAERSNFITTSK
jgi:hypothetical protein